MTPAELIRLTSGRVAKIAAPPRPPG